jgi:Holliday junction resolvase RusA-like endonuclease
VSSPALTQWKKDAGWLLQSQRPARVEGPYRFAIYLPSGMRGDVDGRIKAALDLLVAHGVTSDDKHAVSAFAERSEVVSMGECLVVIEAVENARILREAEKRGRNVRRARA